MAVFIVACSARSMAASVVAKTRWRRCAAASCSRQAASRSACPATCSASTVLASTRARALASSSRARSRALSWSRTSTSSRSRARGSLAIGPSASSALVFCSISSAAASRSDGSDLGRLLADQSLELRGQPIDLSDMRLFARQQVLRLGQIGHPERRELRLGLGLRITQLRFHLRTAAQASVDLDIAHLRLELVAPPEPQRDGRHDHADHRDDRTDHLDDDPEVDDVEELQQDRPGNDDQPDDDERERQPRERSPGGLGRDLEVDPDLARQRGPQLADGPVERSEPLDGGPQDCDRGGRRVGVGELLDLDVDVDRLAIALVALGRRVALGGHPFGLAGLLEQAASFGQRRLRVGSPIASTGQRVAVALELGEGKLPLIERRVRLLDRLFGQLEPAGVPVAAGVELVERLVELLARAARATVGAADRGLEPIAQRALIARQVAQLEVVDGRGRPEETLGRHPGQLGHDLVRHRRIRDRLALVVEPDGATCPGEGLLEACRDAGRPPRPARSRWR